MNTNGLTRHYRKLTARERFPLILAALNRGDEAEAERLTGTAPTRPARVPHYFGLWQRFSLLSAIHHMQPLQRVCAIATAAGVMATGATAEGKGRVLWQLPALRFVAAADGWKVACAELQIDPDAILRHPPGYELVRGMEALARRIATEAADGRALGAQYPIETAADMARGMREFLEQQAQSWQ